MCGSRKTRYYEQRPRDRSMRASDADRERVAERLRRHAGEGRLDTDELEERLEAAFAAERLADLDALTADLPREDRAPRASTSGWAPAAPLVPLLLAAVITLAIVVHPLIWIALWPVLALKHGGVFRGRTAWRGSPS